MNWIKDKFRKCKLLFQYKKLLISIGNSNFRKLMQITLLIVLIGQVGNLCAHDKFPLFFIYQTAFLGILLLSYYSIFYFERFWRKFELETASDVCIFSIRNYLKRKRYRNSNWLYPFIVATSVLIVVHLLYKNAYLDLFMRIYCYCALYIIVFICTIGYTQYVMFIRLIMKIYKNDLPIVCYDRVLPYNTIWIKTLSNTAYKGSSMFFVVGLLYISLFYVFSFTSIFGVDLSINLHLVLITLFWVALIVFIVIAFPCFLLLSLKCINQIIVQLKLQQEKDIRKEISILNNNILLKQLYINVLMNLDRTPNFPEKPLISSIISTGIGIINFFASTQACFSLIQMIKGI